MARGKLQVWPWGRKRTTTGKVRHLVDFECRAGEVMHTYPLTHLSSSSAISGGMVVGVKCEGADEEEEEEEELEEYKVKEKGDEEAMVFRVGTGTEVYRV